MESINLPADEVGQASSSALTISGTSNSSYTYGTPYQPYVTTWTNSKYNDMEFKLSIEVPHMGYSKKIKMKVSPERLLTSKLSLKDFILEKLKEEL